MTEEYNIGDTITLKVEKGGCEGCIFNDLDYDITLSCCKKIKCSSEDRSDKKSIHFVKVDK